MGIVQGISLRCDSPDVPVWKYTTASLYYLVNFDGIAPRFSHKIWGISVLACIHDFLWLLINDKFLTRDNLQKRRFVPDPIASSTWNWKLISIYFLGVWSHDYAGRLSLRSFKLKVVLI